MHDFLVVYVIEVVTSLSSLTMASLVHHYVVVGTIVSVCYFALFVLSIVCRRGALRRKLFYSLDQLAKVDI